MRTVLENPEGTLHAVGGGNGCDIWQLSPDDLSSCFDDSLYGHLFRLHTAEEPGSYAICQHTLDGTVVKEIEGVCCVCMQSYISRYFNMMVSK